MKVRTALLIILLSIFFITNSSASAMPFVYDKENTGAECIRPPLPAFNDLIQTESLPDPFMWSDKSRGRISGKED